jgi:transcriptional regulator
MFVPDSYREPDHLWMVDLIRRNPLALLATDGGGTDGPFATHLPVIPDPHLNGEWSAGLVGAILLGHMNRANPHWEALEADTPAVLSFTGPHAYVSPTVYEVTPAAPTWDFTSVHVRGTIRKIETLEETLEVVKSTVRDFEGAFGSGWDMSESIEYFRKIVPGVGAFRVTVTRAEGMFKLSQEQCPEVRDRVLKCFAGQESSRHRETAELMSRLP